MNIVHQEEDSKGAFKIIEGEETYASMTYSKAGASLFIIDHTEVQSAFTGKGYGLFLLEELIKHVRKNQIKVLPLCPFASALFKKHPEFQDVLNN